MRRTLLTSAVVLLAASVAGAQMDMSTPSGGSGAGPMPGMDMAAMMRMVTCTMSVDDNAVFLVRGNELMKFNKQTLELIASVTLPAPKSVAAMGSGPVGYQLSSDPPAAAIRMPARDLMNQLREMTPRVAEQAYMEAVVQSHAGAIAWSKLAATKALRPELGKFAGEVAKDESAANAKFSAWLKSWYNTPVTAVPSASDTQVLERLRGLSGRDFDVEYMRAMMTHFTEAAAISQVAATKATHAELKTMATSMGREHSAQVRQIAAWLSSWYRVKT